jgi:hypothetical protein
LRNFCISPLLFARLPTTTTTGWIVALVGLVVGIAALAFPIVGLAAAARLVSRGRNAAIALAVARFGLMGVGIDLLQCGMVAPSKSFSPENLSHGAFLSRPSAGGIGSFPTVVMQSSAAAVAATLTAINTTMNGLEEGAFRRSQSRFSGRISKFVHEVVNENFSSRNLFTLVNEVWFANLLMIFVCPIGLVARGFSQSLPRQILRRDLVLVH